MQGRREEMTTRVDKLVEAARYVERPPQGAQERVRGALARRIASGAATSATVVALATETAAAASKEAVANVSLSATAGSGSAWVTASLVKLLAVGLVVGGTVAGGWVWTSRPHSGLPHPVVARTSEVQLDGQHQDGQQPEQPELQSGIPREADAVLDTPGPSTSSATKSPAPSRMTPRGTEHADHLDEELALLRSAQRNLDSGHATAADADLRRYAERFPNGALRSESLGLKILVRCSEGDRTRAEAEIQRLMKSDPDSPVLRRLRQGCPKR